MQSTALLKAVRASEPADRNHQRIEWLRRWHAADPELAALALKGMMRKTIHWRKPTPDLPKQIVQLFLNGLRRDSE